MKANIYTYTETGSRTARTQAVTVNDHLSQALPLPCGVPQGSVLGPVLFILYTKPIADLIQSHSLESQSYADDIQLHVSAPPENMKYAINSAENCISDIMSWMLVNRLKLNNDKTEALLMYSPFKSFPVSKPTSISVCGLDISFSSSARNLGFHIAENMSVELHIKNICRSAFLELRRIFSIRHFLTVGCTKTLVCALVLSKLDYCNSLLASC